MKVVAYPHPSLIIKSVPVIDFDEKLTQLIQDMQQCMHESGGIGLAANQVAINRRVFVMQVDDFYAFINPKIVEKDVQESKSSEGCLSFPKLNLKVKRAQAVTVAWQDPQGQHHQQQFTGLEAVCIQHEIDHLDGITFIERIPKIRKQSTLNDYFKQK